MGGDGRVEQHASRPVSRPTSPLVPRPVSARRLRLRRIAAVVIGIFLVPALMVVVHLTREAEKEPPAPEAFIDCRPYTEPKNVADINNFVAKQRASPGFAGGDVGASTELADGRTFWVFGDTLRPTDLPGVNMVRNSVLLMGEGCAGVYRPADGGAAVPDRGDGVAYWPSTVDSAPDGRGGSRVVVGLMRIKPHGDGPWDYNVIGASAARFEVPANGVPELVEVTDIGPDDPDMTKPLWSAAATLTDDGTVYLFGTAKPVGDLIFGYSMHVARTTVPGLTRPETWEYWNGTSWTSQPADVATLIDAVQGVSRALTVFERDGSWYAVSKKYEFIGSQMVIWKAPAPTGPWVEKEPVADLPTDDRWMTYLALAHPEVLPKKGSIVVSWSVNSVDPSVIANNPMAYRPQFRRVPLP